MTGDILSDRSSELACPRCGATMVRRTRRSDRSGFWGCPNYPRCHGTRPLQTIDAVRPSEPSAAIQNAVPWDDPRWRRAEAGASTRATYNRRLERHRERVREARPRILVFGAAMVIVGIALATSGTTWSLAGWGLVALGVMRTVTSLYIEPPHVRAWAIGAAGEERLGVVLEALDSDGFVILHDLRVPGSRENIDHVLIGPPGVMIVETKTYDGSVRVRRGELYIRGRRKTEFFDQVERQIAAVSTALDWSDVQGFICVLGGEFPWFGRPAARGIEVTPPKRMIETIRSMPFILETREIERLAGLANQHLRR